MIGLALLLTLAGVVLATCRDLTPIVTVIWMFYYIFSGDDFDLKRNGWCLFALVFTVAGLIIHLVRFRPPVFKGEKKGFTYAMFVAAFALCLGGLGMRDRNPVAVLAICALELLIALGALIVESTISADSDNSFGRYVAKLVVISGVLVLAELFSHYIHLGDLDTIIHKISIKEVPLGWGGANNFSPMLALCIPVTMYYAVDKKKTAWLFGALAVLEFSVIMISGCRAAMLFSVLALPFEIIYVIKKTENRLQVFVLLGVTVAVYIAAAIVLRDKLIQLFSRILSVGMDDMGRGELYLQALKDFTLNPVFGTGFDFKLGQMKNSAVSPYWYHNTALQILACTGTVGVLMFAYFYYWRYKTLLTNRTPLNLSLFMAAAVYELCAMLDVNYFPPNCYLMMIILTFAVQKGMSETQGHSATFERIFAKIKRGKAEVPTAVAESTPNKETDGEKLTFENLNIGDENKDSN